MNNRVVITGTGIISPIGNNTKHFWNSLKAGKNGVDLITHFDTTEYNVKIAAQVNIDLNNYFTTKELYKIDRFTAFAIIAADEAILDSNISKVNTDNNRIGVIIGSGIGGINTFEKQHKRLLRNL